MFEAGYSELGERLPDVPEPDGADLDWAEPDWAEPDWAEHPVYSSMVPVSERLSAMLAVSPSARPTGELARIDPRALSASERIDLLAALREQQNWLEAVQLRVLAEIQAADSSKLGLAQEAVSLALKLPPRSAQARLQAGRTIVRELPKTLRLLSRGEISHRHAEVITEAAWRLESAMVAAFEDRVTERVAEQTVSQLRQSVRRAAIALDPSTAEQRQRRALADRRVGFQPLDDGMVQLPVLVGAPQGQLIFTRLTAAATLLPADDPRTMDQQRADLLVDAVLSGLPQGALPELQGRRPSIQVVVSADTLLCLDDEPAHLAGYGPITADTARQLAADESGTWRRLLTDPDTGQLLDISQDSYRPSQRLRDFVAARDGVCTFPTCNQPAYRCEYEHITPYGQGGQTCRCNGALACKRHNLCKIDTGWRYTVNPDGSFTWTDDTGHSYRSHPPQRWRPRRAEAAAEATDGSGRSQVPEPPGIDELHQREDAAYRTLDERWRRELELARRADDQTAAHRIRQAIAAHQRQRIRQLANRADPSRAPF